MNKLLFHLSTFIVSGYIKKIFVFNIFLYNVISSIPFLFAAIFLGFRVKILILNFFFFILLFLINEDFAIKILPTLFLLSINWLNLKVSIAQLKSLFIIFILSFIYSIYQKIFGYNFFEWNFIISEIGSISSLGTTSFEELRSMSFFNHIQTYSLFLCIMILVGYHEKKYLFIWLGSFALILAGSRGLIVSLLSTFIVLISFKNFSNKRVFLINIILYFFLSLLPITGFLKWKDDANRLLVYGTFGYRLKILNDFWNKSNFYNIFFGNPTRLKIYDNSYLYIISNIGVIGLIILFLYLKIILNKFSVQGKIALGLTIGYALYSDVILDLYHLYLILLSTVLFNDYNANKQLSNI